MSALPAGFAGRHALVTGAADGIGFALAQAFADAGMKPVLLDIRADALAEAAGRLNGAETLACDVSDRDALFDCAALLRQRGIRPALLWINAGVGIGASVLEISQRNLDWVLGVNVYGAIWTAQAFVPLLLEADGPHHVGITASSASVTPVSGPFTVYAASKQATAAVGEALAAELAPHGVGVTILCPGLLNTEIWNAARARPDRFGGARLQDHATGERWRQAQGPGILAAPVLASIARGGGWCVVPTEPHTRRQTEQRHAAIIEGFA